jgi:hypothetical protein
VVLAQRGRFAEVLWRVRVVEKRRFCGGKKRKKLAGSWFAWGTPVQYCNLPDCAVTRVGNWATFHGSKIMGVFLAIVLAVAVAGGEAGARHTGKFPLIAGVWTEAEADLHHGPILVEIAQHDGRWEADCAYRRYPTADNKKEVTVRWHVDGTISENGEVAAILVHTVPPEASRQKRTGRLDIDGKAIQLHSATNKGDRLLMWTLKEPREAGKLFAIAYYTPDKKNHAVEVIAASADEAKRKFRQDQPHAAIAKIEEK